jgi:hypothetical protein
MGESSDIIEASIGAARFDCCRHDPGTQDQENESRGGDAKFVAPDKFRGSIVKRVFPSTDW